jgi:hypothetical protein
MQQERAMAQMGKKLTAAQALQGSSSSAGLAALAGEVVNMEIALARSLVDRMDEGDACRHWSNLVHPQGREDELPTAEDLPLWSVVLGKDVQVKMSKRRPAAAWSGNRLRAGLLF